MFIPVGTYMQFIEHIDKDAAGNVSSQKVMGVRVRSIQESFILHSINDCGFAVCSINRSRQTAGE